MNIRTGIGMRGRLKLVWQTAVALLAAFYIQRHFAIPGEHLVHLGAVPSPARS